MDVGLRELQAYEADIQRRAREVLEQLERENRMGIVVLARPYHHDSGLNHEILDEFSRLGYPVFSQSTLPMDADLLERLFGDEVRAGAIRDPLEIQDVWKNSYSASTNKKSGPPSSPTGIRTWSHWSFPASNAGTTRRSIR